MTTYEDGLGGHIVILERGDDERPMRFRMVMPPGFGPPAPESHPDMTEDFKVLRGTLDLGVVEGQRVVLRAGETFTLRPGVFHKPTNGGDDELEFEATLSPGRQAGEMFAALYTETKEHEGLAQFLRVAMVFRRYRHQIRFPAPVRVAMALAAGAARLFGVRSTPVRLPA